MRQSTSRRLKIPIIFLLFFICVLMLKDDNVFSFSEGEITETVVKTIPIECLCAEPNGAVHNFCYTNPHNSSMQGKRFGCQHLEIIKELGLLNPDYIDLYRDEMPEPPFVTTVSANHIAEGRILLRNLHSLWPTRKIIVYDLGLATYRKEYEDNALVELRDFPFKKYPSYVAKLMQYRWKPIIIAEILKEFGAIFYMDSSIIFQDPDLNPIYNQFTCKKGNIMSTDTDSQPKFVNSAAGNEIIKSCNKSSYLFHSPTGHSIFATTLAATYDFLPIDMTYAKGVEMYSAGNVTVVRTREAVDHILKWYVLCALEEKCMAPVGHRLECIFHNRMKDFAGCHRYDQSVVNILSANLFKANDQLYRSGEYGYVFMPKD